jgi:prephenate dehydrogenase
VQQADVVIFSVTVKNTVEVIRSTQRYTRKDQLLMDVTSVKQLPMAAMLRSRAQVVGLHPMFRPDRPFDGQTVVACLGRLTDPRWKTWVVNTLAATRARIKWSTPEEHDSQMTAVQVIPHLGNLASGLLLMERGVSMQESLEFTSPFYQMQSALVARLVGQGKPGLYVSIVLENPNTVAALKQRIAIEQELLKLIEANDRNGLENLFRKARAHFGARALREANEVFGGVLGFLSARYGKDSIILETPKANDKPGLLEEVLAAFQRHKINLTGIYSGSSLDGTKLRFTIGFSQARNSDAVRQALEEIETWPELAMKVATD